MRQLHGIRKSVSGRGSEWGMDMERRVDGEDDVSLSLSSIDVLAGELRAYD